MYSALIRSFVFIALASPTTLATTVKPCKTPVNVQAVVADMENCEEPPCKMKRGSVWLTKVIFTPDKDYEKLHIGIYAEVAGIKRGFPGVDGKEVCDYLYTNPGKVKAGCPLKAGVEHVLEIGLKIEKNFLTIPLTTHWTLRDKKAKKDVWCFDLPIKIE